MKKSVLFSVLCAASFSFAGAQVAPSVANMKAEGNVSLSQIWSNAEVGVAKHLSKENVKSIIQSRAEVSPGYDRPDGTFKIGMTVDYDLSYPSFVGGGVGEFPWRFRNRTTGADETTTYTWNIQDYVYEGDPENNYDLFLIVPQPIIITPPILTATTGTSKKTYQYGAKRDISGETPAQKFLVAGMEQILPLTYADYHYGKLIGTTDVGFAFGSGDLGIPGSSFYSEKDGYRTLGDKEVLKAKGVVTYFEKPVSPLLVKYASFLCLSKSQQPLTEDTELTLEIRKLDENGRVDMESEPLMTSKAAYNDIFQTHPASKEMYVAKFAFEEIDDLGIPVETDLMINEAFAMVVTGFEQPGCDLDVLFAEAVTPKGGSSWLMMEDGTLATYGEDSEGETWPYYDAYMQVVGYFPTLYPVLDYGFAPEEGGLAQVTLTVDGIEKEFNPQFWSNAPGEGENAIEIKDIPSWMNVVIDEKDYEEMRLLYFLVECEPLPSGVSSRTGEIVIANQGIERTIKIGQGPESISANLADQYKVLRSSVGYDLSYPTGATSVTIVNSLGQVIAQYDLSAGGSMTIPASTLSDGLNIFKFSGIGNVAIKAMK